MAASARPIPPDRHGIPTPSKAVFSTFGATLHWPQRRSSPNHDTTTETEPQPGNSSPKAFSDTVRSVAVPGVWTLAEMLRPSPSA